MGQAARGFVLLAVSSQMLASQDTVVAILEKSFQRWGFISYVPVNNKTEVFKIILSRHFAIFDVDTLWVCFRRNLTNMFIIIIIISIIIVIIIIIIDGC